MMSDQKNLPATAGLSDLALGTTVFGVIAAFVIGALYFAPTPEVAAQLSWPAYLALLGAGALAAQVVGFGGLIGACFVAEGVEQFVHRWGPSVRRLFHTIVEFLDDLRESDSGPKQQSTPDKFVDLARLPRDIAEAVCPFLSPGSRYIDPGLLEKFLVEATRLLRAREAFARQESITLDWQNELKLAEARAAYLATLSEEEQALLQLRLEAAAAADARAAHDYIRMECEISQLRAALAAACEHKAYTIHNGLR